MRFRRLLRALHATPVYMVNESGRTVENPRYPRLLAALKRAERHARRSGQWTDGPHVFPEAA